MHKENGCTFFIAERFSSKAIIKVNCERKTWEEWKKNKHYIKGSF